MNEFPCPFCGSETELSHDASVRVGFPGVDRAVPPRRHFRVCTSLDCRAEGPKLPTPESANLAFQRAILA